MVSTLILIDVMISATICPPLPMICLLVPGSCNSSSLPIKYQEAYMGAYSKVKLGVYCLLGVNLEASSQVDWECIMSYNCEHT